MKSFFQDLLSNPIQTLARVPSFLKNKYAITVLFFVAWLLFFDQNDLITQYKLRKELKQLEVEKDYYISKLGEAKADLEELQSNDAKLEKFARENYYMKKDNEDIFVIVQEKD